MSLRSRRRRLVCPSTAASSSCQMRWATRSSIRTAISCCTTSVLGTASPSHATSRSTANKMRTAPLWALRTRNRLMHDGLSFTKEHAIGRHGGQAARREEPIQRFVPNPEGPAPGVSGFALSRGRPGWAGRTPCPSFAAPSGGRASGQALRCGTFPCSRGKAGMASSAAFGVRPRPDPARWERDLCLAALRLAVRRGGGSTVEAPPDLADEAVRRAAGIYSRESCLMASSRLSRVTSLIPDGVPA